MQLFLNINSNFKQNVKHTARRLKDFFIFSTKLECWDLDSPLFFFFQYLLDFFLFVFFMINKDANPNIVKTMNFFCMVEVNTFASEKKQEA